MTAKEEERLPIDRPQGKERPPFYTSKKLNFSNENELVNAFSPEPANKTSAQLIP